MSREDDIQLLQELKTAKGRLEKLRYKAYRKHHNSSGKKRQLLRAKLREYREYHQELRRQIHWLLTEMQANPQIDVNQELIQLRLRWSNQERRERKLAASGREPWKIPQIAPVNDYRRHGTVPDYTTEEDGDYAEQPYWQVEIDNPPDC